MGDEQFTDEWWPAPGLERIKLTWDRGSGFYNTTQAVYYHTANTELSPGMVVKRTTRALSDGFDLRVLPSHALYMEANGPEAAWLPELIFEDETRNRRLQVLSFGGHVAQAGDADALSAAETGFAECMEALSGIDVTNLDQWQTANIEAQRDPALQTRPLVFEGPPTWDAARRAKLHLLWEEVYSRVPEPFGPKGPTFDELWERLEPLLPPVEASGPGRVVHFDGKHANILAVGDFHTTIDWDMVAVTHLAPAHASVVDLVRFLHLDGRNPLTTDPALWLPTAHGWAQAVPDARQAVGQATRFWGPVGQEALFDLANSAACDTLRAYEGSVPVEFGVDAVCALLPLLGFGRIPRDELHTQYSALHGRAPGERLFGAEPVDGPPRRATHLTREQLSLSQARQQTVSINSVSTALADLRRLGLRTGQRETTIPKDVVFALMNRPGLLSGSPVEWQERSSRSLYLAHRTATALRDGIAAGQADLQDASGWQDLPRMPAQARKLIETYFPKPAVTAPVPRPVSAMPAAESLTARVGFAPLTLSARQAMRERHAGDCVWDHRSPTPQPRARDRGRSPDHTLGLDI